MAAKALKQHLKKARGEWDTNYTSVSTYISMVANGSEVLITEAGFDPIKTSKTKKGKPGGINSFSATVNHSKGAVTVGAKNASDNAGAYVFAAVPKGITINYVGNTSVITAGENAIYIAASTKKRIDLMNLPKNTPYDVTMIAYNGEGAALQQHRRK
jgi:hypothetical protein